MSDIGNPNWFALTGLLFVACGFVLIAKGAIGDMTRSLDEAGARRGTCQQRVDGLMSVPFLTVGVVLLMVAQFHHGQFGPGMALLALSAALGLILYAGFESLMVERLLAARDAQTPRTAAINPAIKPGNGQEARPTLQIAHAS